MGAPESAMLLPPMDKIAPSGAPTGACGERVFMGGFIGLTFIELTFIELTFIEPKSPSERRQ